MKIGALIYDLEFNLLNYVISEENSATYEVIKTRQLAQEPTYNLDTCKVQAVELLEFMAQVVSECEKQNIKFIGVLKK